MAQLPVSIRNATEHDADFLAWAILTAARSHLAKGWFDIVLGGTESARLDYLRRLTLTPTRSWWHYSRFLVAEMDGAPAATLSAFRASEAYPLSQQAMIEAATDPEWSEAEKQAMWQRGAYVFTCTVETDDDAWAIENVATLPAFRGRGFAGQLLERAVEAARSNGARQVQITFMIGDDAAEKAYAKAGFKSKDEKLNSEFEAACGAPGLRRYVRDLRAGDFTSR
jgi:GNAT superfamily N-acetyltransferase